MVGLGQIRCRYGPPLVAGRGRLLSRYGWRRGRTGGPTYHAGLDLGAPSGQNATGMVVQAAADGVVERVVRESPTTRAFRGYGNAVILRHDVSWQGQSPVWSFYAHLSAVHVSQGDRVQAAQPIGNVGSTTNNKFPGMGPHLHLELRHATRAGQSPFPGPYRTNNMDPETWLNAHGVSFDRRGMIAWTQGPSGECRAVPNPTAVMSVSMPWVGWRSIR